RVTGKYAYVAAGGAGVGVYDISNPSNIRQVAAVSLPGSAQDIAIRSGYAYVADGAARMAVLNISDPATPTLAAGLSAGNGKTVVGVDADPIRKLAVMALGTDGLALADVSTPSAPVLKGILPGGQVNKVAVRGNAAYLADTARSFTAVDITDLNNPTV